MASNLYNNLYIYWTENQYKVYKNQNLYLVGQEECEELFLDESLESDLKSEFARGLLEIFVDTINNNKSLDNLEKYLKEFPIIQYYFVLADKLRILIKEEVIKKDIIHNIALTFVKEYEQLHIIKFGLTVLSCIGEESDLDLFKLFSNHNEFIFYAIEGIKQQKLCNSIIFNIAKESRGYGRVIAVSSLEPLNKEIREWLITEANKNNILESTIILITFNEEDYIDYFFEGRITKKKYEVLTRNLKLLYECKEYFSTNISLNLIERYYFQYFIKYDSNFEKLYVMTSLLGLFSKIDNEDKLISNLNLNHDEVEVLDYIKSEIDKEDYSEVIKGAINDKKTNKQDIITLAFVLGYELDFEDFKIALRDEPLNYAICSYIMIGNKVQEKDKLIDYVNKYIDYSKVAKHAEKIYEDDIEKYNLHDSILYLIVFFMDELKEKYIDINIRALSARYTPTRKAAFNNLKYLALDILDKHIKAIEYACDGEVDLKLKESMKRFLSNRERKDIIRRYENFEKVKVHVNDIYLTESFICGTKDFDLTMIEEKLKLDESIYLKRDKKNIHDKNAIMVLADNGYLIGYLSKDENHILKNLIDGGKVIYGKVSYVSEDFRDIEVKLYLSSIDIIKQVSEAFSMITDNPIGYIN